MATVALVGRPNVGKSTLFNRLVGGRPAIAHREPGVTRDRVYGEVQWRGRRFQVVDTGGVVPGDETPLAAAIRRQVEVALAEADLVVLLVDGEAGLTPADEQLAHLLRRAGRPALVAVNKVDHGGREGSAAEFYRLGLGDPVPISAEHGRNVSSLLDRMVAALPADAPPPEPEVSVAILGRPNVGKSTLLNALLGQERAITSELPGTTRDPVDSLLQVDGRVYRLVDTAGLRRGYRRASGLEYYSALRATRALERADVALLVLDATEGVTHQDRALAGLTREAGKGLVVVANKWDLLGGDGGGGGRRAAGAADDRLRPFREALAVVSYAPLLAISARTGRHVDRILPAVARVQAARSQRVPTSLLNRVIREAVDRHHPPAPGGARLKIYYAVQTGVAPPAFDLFCNHPERLPAGYARYLENQLRASFDFTGTPLILRPRPRRP